MKFIHVLLRVAGLGQGLPPMGRQHQTNPAGMHPSQLPFGHPAHR